MFTVVSRMKSGAAAPSIGFGLEAQRVLAERADQRLIVCRDDDDAGIGDGVATAIFLQVVADERAARDEHIAVDDRAPDPRVASHPNAGHQDALFDVTKTVHPDVRTEHAAVNTASGHDAPWRDHRVQRLAAADAAFREHELR